MIMLVLFAFGCAVTGAIVWAETRNHWQGQVANVRHQLATATLVKERQMAELDATRRELAAARTDLAIARPPNPIVAHLARCGPATTDELVQRFGTRTAARLAELSYTQEVGHDGDRWTWRPPSERYLPGHRPTANDTAEMAVAIMRGTPQ